MNISNQLGILVGWFQFPTSRIKTFFLVLLSLFFTYAGIDHLISPDFYVSIMPPWIPWHLELVYISGVFEVMARGRFVASRIGEIHIKLI